MVLLVFQHFAEKKISDDYMEMFGIKGKKKGHGNQETSLSVVFSRIFSLK